MTSATEDSSERSPIHVVDLGEANPGEVRDLKRGRGELIDDIDAALEQVGLMFGSESGDKRILPLVVVVEKKKSAKSSAVSMFPIPFPFLP
jgi:hypothetical protein